MSTKVTECKTVLKPDYKNWMPKGMIFSFLGAAVLSIALCLLLRHVKGLAILLAILAVIFCEIIVWSILMYRAFSYNGKRRMSAQIIEGTAARVKLPAGGKCLDVGCGSGALAIAVAKRNPQAFVIGIDRWGAEYASFNKALCENNAKAEGVGNTAFRQGDATHLDFPDGTFDAVVSNYVYHNIPGERQKYLLETLRTLKKGGAFALHDIFSKSRYGDMQAFVQKLGDMGYQKVELIDTTDGRFMTPFEARWMALSGSALLTGIK